MRLGLGLGMNKGLLGGETPPTVSNVQLPTAESNAVVGQVYTVTYNLGGGTPDTIVRTWYKDGIEIFTSTSSDSYTLVSSDAGNTANLYVNVYAVNSAGASGQDSNTITTIYDLNAWNFIVEWQSHSALTMGSNQKLLNNETVLAFKSANLWNTFVSRGVFLRIDCPASDTVTNANAYSVNLVNPSQKAVFTGFLAGDFTVNGIIGGTSKFVRYPVSPSTYPQNDVGHWTYCRTNATNTGCAFGAAPVNIDTGSGTAMFMKWTDNNTYSKVNTASSYEIVTNVLPTTLGLIGHQRTAGGAFQLIQNTTLRRSSTAASTTPVTTPFNGHACNTNGVASGFDNRQHCGQYLGVQYLTGTDLTNFYTIIQNYQTKVISGGRQV